MTEGEIIAVEAIEALSEYDMFQALEARLEDLLVVFQEILVVLGNMYALMIFFAVVLLCWFVYKFFRMFF